MKLFTAILVTHVLFFAAGFAAMADELLGSAVVIESIQTEGASADDEFVDIVSHSSEPVLLHNWRLIKKTGSGSEYNLLVFPDIVFESGKRIRIQPKTPEAPSVYFSSLSYSTQNRIAKNNAIVLINDKGQVMDMVGFGSSSFFESAPAENPAVGSVLHRRNVQNISADTDNNALDFLIVSFEELSVLMSSEEQAVDTSDSETVLEELPEEDAVTEETSSPDTSETAPADAAVLIAGYGEALISELVSAPEANESEWVELYNPTRKNLSLEGLVLADGSGAKTILSGNFPALAYVVISQPKGKLNNSGDLLLLTSAAGEVLDRVAYGNWKDDQPDHPPAPKTGFSLARQSGFVLPHESKGFALTQVKTPGAVNQIVLFDDDEKEEADQKGEEAQSSGHDSLFSKTGRVLVSEIFPFPKENAEDEWIELVNTESFEIDLSGWKISDTSGKNFTLSKKDFVSTVIGPKSFFLIPRSVSDIALNNSGSEILTLTAANGAVISEVLFDAQNYQGWSYAWVNDQFVWTLTPTPGSVYITSSKQGDYGADIDVLSCLEPCFSGEEILVDASDSPAFSLPEIRARWNFGDGTKEVFQTEAWHIYEREGVFVLQLDLLQNESVIASAKREITVRSAQEIETIKSIPMSLEMSGSLMINELMPNPEGDDSGEWLELYNSADTAIDLAGFALHTSSDKHYELFGSVMPKEYMTVPRIQTKLILNNTSLSVWLSYPDGTASEKISYTDALSGQSYAFHEGSFVWTSVPTPGTANEINEGASAAGNAAEEVAFDEVGEYPLGSLVRIKGIVTVPLNVFAKNTFYIGGLGGIMILVPENKKIELKLGQLVSVEGTLRKKNGEVYVAAKHPDDVVFSETSSEIIPLVLDADPDESWLGRLVVMEGEVLEKHYQRVVIQSNFGEVEVYSKKNTKIVLADISAGKSIRVTGIVAKNNEEFRILPRFQTDIVMLDVSEIVQETATESSGNEVSVSTDSDESQNRPSPSPAAATIASGAGVYGLWTFRKKVFEGFGWAMSHIWRNKEKVE